MNKLVVDSIKGQNNKEEAKEEVKPTNETRGRWGDDQRHDNKDRQSEGGNGSMGHSLVTFVLHFFSIHFKGFFFFFLPANFYFPAEMASICQYV